MAKALEWITEKRKVNDLVELEFNPRKITEAKRQKLIDSLTKFNLAEIPAINTDNKVIAGNQRLKALQMAGRGEELIDVRVPNRKLNDKELKEYAIISNSHAGEWDFDILEMEFADIDLGDIGIDMKEIEFEQSEAYGKAQKTFLDRKEAALLKAEEDDFDIPDEIKTDIVIGDLFEIGPHRLLCGDSTDSDQVAKLMNGEKADMVFTDPPYSSGGYQESGKTSGSIGARGNKTIATDNLSTRGYISLMDKVLANLHTAHSIFVFCDWKMWVYNQDISEAKGYRVRNMIVWDKMQMGMGMPFRNQHELILFGSKIAGKIGNGKTPNVLQYKRDREAVHFTPKPIGLISEMLQQIESENLVDPFSGGGSTMVAAHQLNRKCYGMELDPKYCQVIIDRMLKLDPTLTIKRNGELYNGAKVSPPSSSKEGSVLDSALEGVVRINN